MYNVLTETTQAYLGQTVALAVWSALWPYLLMLAGFSAIVFVHELGHFVVAKWAGVRVERFAVGFGREIFGFTRGETRYSFNILPLGGYVKMLGQEDFDDKEQELLFKDDPRSFINKPVGHRMAIVSAGVVMNVVFAGLLFMIVFMIGMEAETTRIGMVQPDSPADRAGFQPGDVIEQINGDRVLEFNEVSMAVLLAPHEPIEFVVRRDGQRKTIAVKPEYQLPEASWDVKRQIVGISPGQTPEIAWVGPEIDPTRPDHPHVGDMLVEIDGIEITEENASEALQMLAYHEGKVVVARKDPANPNAPPERVRVEIPPMLSIYPTGEGPDSAIHILGLQPLMRISAVEPEGRAYYAGIETGDTILMWDDIDFPDRRQIARAIEESPERDIPFTVRKADGQILHGFVRPDSHRRGAGTIQATIGGVDADDTDGPRAVLRRVQSGGEAYGAGFRDGDLIVSLAGKVNPTAAQANKLIQESANRTLHVTVRKPDGRELSTYVAVIPSGTINAQIRLVAVDFLQMGGVVAEVGGRPTPAFEAGIAPGETITSVNGDAVTDWRELIRAFRRHAGSSVELRLVDPAGQERTVAFSVPHSLRTLLGVGPQARIVSIDGRRSIRMETSAGQIDADVGYHRATEKLLSELVGETITVEYRPNPLADVQRKEITVGADTVDPWLSRIMFAPAVQLAPETKLLKGENALDALMIGVHKTYTFVIQVYTIIERMFFTRSIGFETVSGPVGIFHMGGRVARAGLVDFLFFMAVISANLAVLNFLPLPVVDGGLMVFLIIEKIKGTPVSIKVQVATQMIGIFLIVGIFLYVTFNDVMRIWG